MSAEPRRAADKGPDADAPGPVAVTGSFVLRLRGVRVTGQAEPLDADIAAGDLHVLPVAEPEGTQILRVLAGEQTAEEGSVTTLTGTEDLTTTGRRAVLALQELDELDSGRAEPAPMIGLLPPRREPAADIRASVRAREALLFLTAVEGRTIVASCDPFDEP